MSGIYCEVLFQLSSSSYSSLFVLFLFVLWVFFVLVTSCSFLNRQKGVARCLTALAALGSLVIGRFAERNVGAGADRSLGTIAAVESLGGDDAVDLCAIVSTQSTFLKLDKISVALPVKMFWKASSTLLASKAEVSMKERWFSPS